MRLATQREELRIVRDQTDAPTWSREIARATTEVLAQLIKYGDISAALSRDGGTYHMTVTGETNWNEFTPAILEETARVPPRLLGPIEFLPKAEVWNRISELAHST